jgi:PAS domain S-box-containing protein
MPTKIKDTTVPPDAALESLPAVVFQFSAGRLHLLNRELAAFPGLSASRMQKIIRGEWSSIVPEEFHPVVRKLAALKKSPGHTTVEFPSYWMGHTVWLRVFAASAPQEKEKRNIIGLVQDVTSQRLGSGDAENTIEAAHEEEDHHWRKLRHDVNGSLTSILMNCELLLEKDWLPLLRKKIESILSEALRIDQLLQHYRE